MSGNFGLRFPAKRPITLTELRIQKMSREDPQFADWFSNRIKQYREKLEPERYAKPASQQAPPASDLPDLEDGELEDEEPAEDEPLSGEDEQQQYSEEDEASDNDDQGSVYSDDDGEYAREIEEEF